MRKSAGKRHFLAVASLAAALAAAGALNAQVNVPQGSGGITVGQDHYELVQFHFHHPSEERIHHKRSAMVMHLVHKNAKGELAVVAVLIHQGAANALTTPPCSEHVHWFELKEPIDASSAKIAKFAKHYPHNVRPTQPLNARAVEQTAD
jgi:carbonic anhydrase